VPLAEFQRAFAAAMDDPAWAATRLAEPDAAATEKAGARLTPAERERLRRLLQHQGMAANRMLRRSTRAMPLHSALPLTFAWLRQEATAVLDAWARQTTDASVQYAREVARFAVWLPGFLTATRGRSHPALDALRFEGALAAMTEAIEARAADPDIAVVFAHDPDVILAGWRADAMALARPITAHLRLHDGNVVLLRDDAT